MDHFTCFLLISEVFKNSTQRPRSFSLRQTNSPLLQQRPLTKIFILKAFFFSYHLSFSHRQRNFIQVDFFFLTTCCKKRFLRQWQRQLQQRWWRRQQRCRWRWRQRRRRRIREGPPGKCFSHFLKDPITRKQIIPSTSRHICITDTSLSLSLSLSLSHSLSLHPSFSMFISLS